MPTTRKGSKPGGKFKKKPPADSPLKTLRQIALEHHIGENTISKAIYDGKFPATGTATAWMIDTRHAAFKAWLKDIKEWSKGPNESNARRREILAKARAAKVQKKLEQEKAQAARDELVSLPPQQQPQQQGGSGSEH